MLVLEYCARKSVDGILAGGLTDPKVRSVPSVRSWLPAGRPVCAAG